MLGICLRLPVFILVENILLDLAIYFVLYSLKYNFLDMEASYWFVALSVFLCHNALTLTCKYPGSFARVCLVYGRMQSLLIRS